MNRGIGREYKANTRKQSNQGQNHVKRSLLLPTHFGGIKENLVLMIFEKIGAAEFCKPSSVFQLRIKYRIKI